MQHQHFQEHLEALTWLGCSQTRASHRTVKIGLHARNLVPGFTCGCFRHLQRDCPMMDCSFGEVWIGESHAPKQPNGKVTIPVAMGRLQVATLVNSGCGQSLVHQRFVTSDLAPGVIRLLCIHEEVKPYSSTWVTMMMNEVIQAMPLGLAPRLAYLVILGRDWGEFTEVLTAANIGTPPAGGWSSREIPSIEWRSCVKPLT